MPYLPPFTPTIAQPPTINTHIHQYIGNIKSHCGTLYHSNKIYKFIHISIIQIIITSLSCITEKYFWQDIEITGWITASRAHGMGYIMIMYYIMILYSNVHWILKYQVKCLYIYFGVFILNSIVHFNKKIKKISRTLYNITYTDCDMTWTYTWSWHMTVQVGDIRII